jgi:hypothetical protein
MDEGVQEAAALAEEARQTVRMLNHVTRPAGQCPGLESPQDVYRVLGSLRDLAAGLQQTMAQLNGWLEYQLQDGRLEAGGAEYADDPLAAVSAAGAALDHAQLHAGTLAGMLADAQAAVGAMYAAVPEELVEE